MCVFVLEWRGVTTTKPHNTNHNPYSNPHEKQHVSAHELPARRWDDGTSNAVGRVKDLYLKQYGSYGFAD